MKSRVFLVELLQFAHHRDRVVDIDEVAALVAVGDTGFVRFEQFDRLAGLRTFEHLGENAGHVTLVVLVRAIDVEELEADPARRQVFFFDETVGQREVEQMLAPAV